MTWKDLQKLTEQYETATTASSDTMQNLLKRLRNRPFYIWSTDKHKAAAKPTSEFKGNCCFQHIISAGPPKKNGVPQPFWDYQKMIYYALTIPNYVNSIAAEDSTVSHNNMQRKEKERLKQEKYFHPFKLKHLWIKKATGLGVTEFMLRFMAWLALRNDDYQNSQMVIVTGPNQELAIKMIKRLKGIV